MWVNDIMAYLKQFEGKTVYELCNEMEISTTAKSKNYVLVNALLSGYEGKNLLKFNLNRYEINVKTIQLNFNGKPKEAMSFATIDFEKLTDESWNDSDFKYYLLHDFLFFVFKETERGNILDKIFLWHMPQNELEGEVREVWEDTKEKLLKGDIIKEVKGTKVVTTFKNELSTNICHVRPHGSASTDTKILPVPDIHTGYRAIPKQSFWFNHKYINEILKSKGA